MITLNSVLYNKLGLFLTTHENLVNRYYLYMIRRSIFNGDDRCSLIYLEDRKASLDIPRKSFRESLEYLLTRFIAAEMYEEAHVCKNLLNKLTIDNLIQSSQL